MLTRRGKRRKYLFMSEDGLLAHRSSYFPARLAILRAHIADIESNRVSNSRYQGTTGMPPALAAWRFSFSLTGYKRSRDTTCFSSVEVQFLANRVQKKSGY